MNCIIFFLVVPDHKIFKKIMFENRHFPKSKYIFFYYLPVGLDIRQTQV